MWIRRVPCPVPSMRTTVRTTVVALTTLATLASLTGCAVRSASSGRPVQFSVSFPSSLHDQPVTGRVFVLLSADSSPEPRLAAGNFTAGVALFGTDVDALAPGQSAIISDTTHGYPIRTPRDIPPGDYYAQAVLNVYTQFHRADGHTIWAHMDQWEGQQLGISPGNLVSPVQRVHIDAQAGSTVSLALARTLPAVEMPGDSRWVKHIKILSDRLTKFWGHPFYLGATVLLPAGYDTHPASRYPVIYEQGHFNLDPPLGFDTAGASVPTVLRDMLASYNLEPGLALYHAWSGPHFPRLIAVTFQHPTPYFDDSYAVNSANNGPYGDAIMQELIPYLESHFRMIPQAYARVLTGGSTGGWESLALQLYHPDFFGGTWTLYPDPVDFRHYDLVDAYADTNAFLVTREQPPFSPVSRFFSPERYIMRGNDGQPLISLRDFSRLEDVLGSHDRSAEQLEIWEAVYGPVGDDGYPKPLWDKKTGHIDHAVATAMREHGYDLTAYLRQHWATVGPQLVDKIHVDVGDMDNFYLNLAVYDLQRFLDSTQAPHVAGDFRYGRPEKGHGWQHTSTTNLVREMADAITRHAPAGAAVGGWKY